MRQLPILPGLLPLLHFSFPAAANIPGNLSSKAGGFYPGVCRMRRVGGDNLAGIAGLFPALQEPEAFTRPAWGASLRPTLNKYFQPWLDSLQVICVQCFGVYKALVIYITSLYPHNNPARQDPNFVSKVRKPKLRVFKWLSPGHLAKCR